MWDVGLGWAGIDWTQNLSDNKPINWLQFESTNVLKNSLKNLVKVQSTPVSTVNYVSNSD